MRIWNHWLNREIQMWPRKWYLEWTPNLEEKIWSNKRKSGYFCEKATRSWVGVVTVIEFIIQTKARWMFCLEPPNIRLYRYNNSSCSWPLPSTAQSYSKTLSTPVMFSCVLIKDTHINCIVGFWWHLTQRLWGEGGFCGTIGTTPKSRLFFQQLINGFLLSLVKSLIMSIKIIIVIEIVIE